MNVPRSKRGKCSMCKKRALVFGTSERCIICKHRAGYASKVSDIMKRLLNKPQKCKRCGSVKNLHIHHPNYAQPLRIEILCRNCHYRAHGRRVVPFKCKICGQTENVYRKVKMCKACWAKKYARDYHREKKQVPSDYWRVDDKGIKKKPRAWRKYL